MTAYDLVRSASTAVLVLRSAATSRPAHESWRRRGAAAGRVWCVGGALGVGEGGRRWLALEGAPTYPLTTSYHLVARTSGHHRPKAVRRRPQQARPDRGTAQPNSFAASRGEIEDRTWPSSTTPLPLLQRAGSQANLVPFLALPTLSSRAFEATRLANGMLVLGSLEKNKLHFAECGHVRGSVTASGLPPRICLRCCVRMCRMMMM